MFTASASSNKLVLQDGADVLSIYNAFSTGQPVYIYGTVVDVVGGYAMWHIERCAFNAGVYVYSVCGTAMINGLSTQLKIRAIYGAYLSSATELSVADFTMTNS